MFEKIEIIENAVNEVQEIDYKKLLNDCYVDLSEDLQPPETLLSIGTHLYKGKHYDTSVCTAGEVSAITAVSKAKKSFLKSALIGSYIGGSANLLFSNIKTHRTEDFTILDFDTEQGNYYAQRTFRRVPEIAGNVYENYRPYVTRSLSSEQRLKLIDTSLKEQENIYKTPVKLVCIDGIADLIDNTNDIEMSKMASDYLMKWTYEYNIHINTIIHKSGLTNKPLGHLGTFCLKKAESVINLDVIDENIVEVSNSYSRGYRFDTFQFSINSDALPYLIE